MQSKAIAIVTVSALSWLAACGGSTPGPGDGGGDAGAQSDVDGDQSGDTAADGGTDAADGDAAGTASWWTCPTVTGTKTPRAAGCEAPDDGSYGCKRAWYGLVAGGVTYTCNRCRGGDPKAQGSWRAIDFATEDPSVPLPEGRREVLIVDGNTWHLRSAKNAGGGAGAVEVRVDGWYACADPAELKSGNVLFSTTAAAPNDTLGWYAPDVFSGHFLSKGTSLLAWGFYAGVETDWIGDALYCRVGTTVAGKPCVDPFAPGG